MANRLAALAFLVAISDAPLSHPVRSIDPMALDAASRSVAVETVAAALRDDYVDIDLGAQAASKIRQALASGAYDALATPQDLAIRLNADVAAVTRDPHLRIGSLSAPDNDSEPSPSPPANEAGVARADRLPGRIGYLEIVGFPDLDRFKMALDRAMIRLATSKAIIIDMRRNTGGAVESVVYLASFFIPPGPGVHLMDGLKRRSGTTEFETTAYFSARTPTHVLGRPVSILTSSQTFSGGEVFSDLMQGARRAVIVGQTTRGGANGYGPGDMGRLQSAGLLVLSLPTTRLKSAFTRASFESVGVKPDVPTSAALALKVALARLGENPKSGEISELSEGPLFAFRKRPSAGTESALRRILVGGARPADLAPMLDRGSDRFESLRFAGVTANGEDCFVVKYPWAERFWAISLDSKGKVKIIAPTTNGAGCY